MKFAVRLFLFCINSNSKKRVTILWVWGYISYLQIPKRNTHEVFKKENGKRVEKNSNTDSVISKRTKGS